MDFCPKCGELLVVDTRIIGPEEAKNKLYYTCLKCKKRQEAKKKDYKLFEENFTKQRNIEILVKNACDNITVPRKIMKCPHCKKEEIIAVLRMESSMKGIFVCCKCKKYWE